MLPRHTGQQNRYSPYPSYRLSEAAPRACSPIPILLRKPPIIRIYDHEVQGGTVIKPLTGAQKMALPTPWCSNPSAHPARPRLILGAGINPEYGKHDPYRMALSVVDEAIRNAVAVGGDPHSHRLAG